MTAGRRPARPARRARMRRGRRSAARAARRARRRARRSSPTTAALLTERVALLRATLPAGVDLSYAIKANPMPAVVQHLSRARRLARRRLRGARCRSRSTPRCPPQRVSFAGPGKTPAELAQAVAAGVTIEMESETEAQRLVADRRAAGHPSARRRARQPGLPGQGLGNADGRRPAAVRRRRGARTRAAADGWPGPTSRSSGSTSSPARRTCTPRSCARRSAGPSSWRCALPTTRRRRCRYLNLGGGFGIPYFEKDAPLDLAAIGANLDGAAAPTTIRPAPPGRARRRRARPLHRRRVRRLRHPGRRPQGVSRQDVPRRRRRPASSARRVRQLRPGDPPQLPGRGRRPRVRPIRPRRSASSAACARRSTCSATTSTLPRAEHRRSRRRLPGRRLRPDGQPDGVPEPPGTRRGARLAMTVLVVLAVAVGLPGLAAAAHLGLLARASVLYRSPRPRDGDEIRFLVLVPAHNEAQVIGRCLAAIYADARTGDRSWWSPTAAPTRPRRSPGASGRRCSSASAAEEPGRAAARQAGLELRARLSSGTPW